MPTQTILWYDYETTGTDPVRDRPAQFAAIRTDQDLHGVGDPVVLWCAPAIDVLPHPEACLVTGIAPQDAARDGTIEADFAAAVHELLAEPGTCSAGYNSIRFDDVVNRNLFYRNFLDPYEHAWKNGNSRWDIMDLARACHALRPDGIAWPMREDDTPSFRLEHLAQANRLEQERAHDALCDVTATIGLARLLRDRQPRLYQWAWKLKDRKFAASQIASRLSAMQPLLHVSGRYAPAHGCLAMVAPLAACPGTRDKFIVADLAVDPAGWALLDPEDLAERMFTRRADLPDDVERPPLKALHANRSPFLAPVETLRSTDTSRIGLDPARCQRNLDALRAIDGVRERVQRAFALREGSWPARTDPELRLYDGFPSDADKRRFAAVRATPPDQLGALDPRFDDGRYAELLFRYRARNWPDSLDPDEASRWRGWVRDRLQRENETTTLTLDGYFAAIARLRAETPPGPAQALLDRLEDWGRTIRAGYGA